MAIFFNTEDTAKPKISFILLKRWLNTILRQYDKNAGEINFIFCSDNYFLEINNKFLMHDYFTDIITFDYCEGLKVSGDIYISLDRVKDNSELFGYSFLDELLRVIVHGLLHLLGYKDKANDEIILIRKLEDEFVDLFMVMKNGYIK